VQDQPRLRYVGSFKRQFKEQEARSLRDRIRQRQGQVGPDCVCLVAIEEADGKGPEVLGTLDLEPPGSALARDREAPAVSALPIATEYGRERLWDIHGHLAWIRRRVQWMDTERDALHCRSPHMCSMWWCPASIGGKAWADCSWQRQPIWQGRSGLPARCVLTYQRRMMCAPSTALSGPQDVLRVFNPASAGSHPADTMQWLCRLPLRCMRPVATRRRPWRQRWMTRPWLGVPFLVIT
jgi:hypothetical protein